VDIKAAIPIKYLICIPAPLPHLNDQLLLQAKQKKLIQKRVRITTRADT
jgi:hypothetical protein